MIQPFIATTIKCGCQKIRSLFRVLGMYNFEISIKNSIPYKLTQPPYSCFRPTNTTVATEATMVASKPNVVATAAIRNHKVNGGPGMYFSILAKIRNIMTNIAIFVSKSYDDNFFPKRSLF